MESRSSLRRDANRIRMRNRRATLLGRVQNAVCRINCKARRKGEPLFNLTATELCHKFVRQGSICGLCGKHRKLCIDHDHATGKFRGLICAACNTAIANLGDNIEGLSRAIKYLEN